MAGTENRLKKIENIRVLAIILVVLGHSIILYSPGWDLFETTRQAPLLSRLKRMIDLIQMPLFFSLSGYLFVFTHQKKWRIWKLASNKFARLLVPYFGIGLLYMVPIRFSVGYSGYVGNHFGDIISKILLANDVGHLWFLPALFITFLISEIILTLVEKISPLKNLSGLILLIMSGLLYLEGYRIGLGYGPLLSAYNYLIWFSLGYCINTYGAYFQKLYEFCVIKWGLLLINLFLLGFVFVTSTPVGLLLSVGLSTLMIFNIYVIMPEKSYSIVEKIDRNSFGIYLFHSPLIYITFACIPNANPGIVVFVNFIVFGVTAFGLTELVRRTRLKVLIGEMK
ncbi:MAG: acyltransferase [Lachnospiraceae bacterium]|nr:acyltransferase [Lachnospiraceae bacterium]